MSCSQGQADKGDSGGGLTFVREGTHFVYGIISTKPLTGGKQVRLFTNLMNDGHRAWLLRQWRRLQVQHGDYLTHTNIIVEFITEQNKRMM